MVSTTWNLLEPLGMGRDGKESLHFFWFGGKKFYAFLDKYPHLTINDMFFVPSLLCGPI